jgi:alpha/beta superfamily hydrolase
LSRHSLRKLFIDGPAGKLETALGEPASTSLRGIAVVAHPHPLYGGTMNNKVVHTLFKSFLELGFIAVKFNFRGVEQSEGLLYSGKDNGRGETEDVVAVAKAITEEYREQFQVPPPLLLAGFSFGGAIQAFAAQHLKPQYVALVAPAVQRLNAPAIVHPAPEQDEEHTPSRVLIVHGDQDTVVPLNTVLEWAAPQELPVVVVPGAEHFFHRRLHILKGIVVNAWEQ